MQVNNAKEILKKYREGTATDAEKALLSDWLLFDEELKDHNLSVEEIEQQMRLMEKGLPLKKQRNYKLFSIITIAATALLYAGTYYVNCFSVTAPAQVKKITNNDIAPAGNKAVLTLANGSHIVLDDAKFGKLATQGNTAITKTMDGKIVYNCSGINKTNAAASTIAYNTITTPKGGVYQLVLPDGSNVWLNTSSSLSYPLAFTGKKREIKLTGEAYFEVAKDQKKPFVVTINSRQQVEVLGTHFNVMGYNDDHEIQTTLMEGAVKLTYGDNKAMLKPGQQGTIKVGQSSFNIKSVNTDDFVAWKNGMFIFNYENITDIMKTVSRWYDVDVVFKGDMQNVNFVGNYSRNKTLSNLLKYLELSKKVNFVIEGRRVTATIN